MSTNPNNIVRIRTRNGGRGSVYEANMWAQPYTTGLLSGEGVRQNTVPDLTVIVGGTSVKPDVVIGANAEGYRVALDIVGQAPLAIEPPVSNSRIAAIVAYTDDLSVASEEEGVTGSPATCGLIVVYGNTSSSPAAPTDAMIRTAITSDGVTGSQAVYAVVAEITVASSSTALTSSTIAMSRALLGAEKIDFNEFPSVSIRRTAAWNPSSAQTDSNAFFGTGTTFEVIHNRGAQMLNSTTGATPKFNAPYAGVYSVSMGILRDSGTGLTTIGLRKGGSVSWYTRSQTIAAAVNFSAVIECAQGEEIEPLMAFPAGANNFPVNTNLNYFAIRRVVG